MDAELEAIKRQAAYAGMWYPLAGCIERLADCIAERDKRIAILEALAQAQKRQWESLQRDTHGRLLLREARLEKLEKERDGEQG